MREHLVQQLVRYHAYTAESDVGLHETVRKVRLVIEIRSVGELHQGSFETELFIDGRIVPNGRMGIKRQMEPKQGNPVLQQHAHVFPILGVQYALFLVGEPEPIGMMHENHIGTLRDGPVDKVGPEAYAGHYGRDLRITGRTLDNQPIRTEILELARGEQEV